MQSHITSSQEGNTTPQAPVLREIVARELCCGCGVCAAMCPTSCLYMEFNRHGEYNPSQKLGCTDCGSCSNVCPFADGNPNEDIIAAHLYGSITGIGKRKECGYYLSSFVGYSNAHNQRKNGASGGLATWTLRALLERGEIDHVICASTNPDPKKLFKFVVVDNAEDLQGCANSSYYPLELSEVLKYVIENDGRYAVTGLPCVIKALRLAEIQNAKLRKRIVFHAGIVCGMLLSSFNAEYVAKLVNQEPSAVRKIIFRDKGPDLPSNHPLVTVWNDPSLQPIGQIEHLNGPSVAWENWLFKHNSCNYCDDVFAELADAVFMDAWLPEYSSKPGGDSLVITRTSLATDIISSGIDSRELTVSEISIERVILSQKPLLKDKRDDLAIRLRILEERGIHAPKKRVFPSADCSIRAMQFQKVMLAMQADSRDAWLATGDQETSAFFAHIPAYIARQNERKYFILRRKVWNGLKLVTKIIAGKKTC